MKACPNREDTNFRHSECHEEKGLQKWKQRNKTTKTSRHPRSENLYVHELTVAQKKPNTKDTNEQNMSVGLSVAADTREGPK